MLKHRDRRATPPGAKIGPPLRGRPEKPAGEQAAMPPAWLKLSGGQFHLLTVACLRVASATRLRCAPCRMSRGNCPRQFQPCPGDMATCSSSTGDHDPCSD